MPREMFSLRDRDGRFAGWVGWTRAVELIGTRQLKPIWFGNQIRALELANWRTVALYETGSAEHHARYSHNHDVAEYYIGADGRPRPRNELDANPEGCWTLKRLPSFTAPIFRAVLDSVAINHATPAPRSDQELRDDRRERGSNVVCIRGARQMGAPVRVREIREQAA